MASKIIFLFFLLGISHQCSVVRFMSPDQLIQWGVTDIYTSQQTDSILVLRNSEHFPSTLQLFSPENYKDVYNACFKRSEHFKNQIWETIEKDRVEILAPVSPDSVLFTTQNGYTIQKPSTSIGTPNSAIMKAPFISLLDLEISLGFIIAKDFPTNQIFTRDNIDEFIGGVVLMNTFFSKDMEILEGSPLNSHSLPSYTKVGPYILLISETDSLETVLDDLKATVHVGKVQKPVEISYNVIEKLCIAASAVSAGYNGRIGDILQVNLGEDKEQMFFVRWINDFLSIFLDQSSYRSALLWYYNSINNSGFLATGIQIRSSVRSQDHLYDLGMQQTMIRPDTLKNWQLYQPTIKYNDGFMLMLFLSLLVWIVLIGIAVYFLRYKRKVKKE